MTAETETLLVDGPGEIREAMEQEDRDLGEILFGMVEEVRDDGDAIQALQPERDRV